jgi:hypothetical protein
MPVQLQKSRDPYENDCFAGQISQKGRPSKNRHLAATKGKQEKMKKKKEKKTKTL